ncbi:MAG: CRISPR-associated helicase Cas3', partial [Phycisphaerae bacterium]|nr:CRISPR-associated helicase Cas3' [Phycisphaerae bacterium]
RMLYSCLVDADFLDTEAFMDLQRSVSRRGYPSLMDLSDIFFSRLAAKRELSTPSQVNRRRNYVLDQCMRGAEHNMGLFSLTVPTGGGKTLSSMAFAIRHAIRHGLKRIIYVIPFTSIIEQNAAVFRDFLGEGAVLEHHSNFEPKDEDYRSRLAAENWDAPVVVTTNVQFFESLFSNRSSRCRKLHNIAESVIILDEVQTLPAPFLLPCLETIQELVSSYRTSFMLCSATQPAVQERSDFRHGLKNITEIIENPAELSMSMKRTMTKVLPQTKDSDLAVQLAQQDQVLCIVNTRKHASQIYGIMKGTEGLYHLSALMCPVHRSHVLNQIRDRLAKSQPCRVVSTQLIEAGVDIDFPVVYRAMAGIDSIAQAAGRCNREGKKEFGQVFVFTPESGIPAGHFRQTAQAAESVTRRFSDDILSLSAIEEYFKMYYWQKGDALDKEEILAMLQAGCGKGDFPFKTIAEKFQFIKDSMKPVIIPFDDQARKLIQLLEHHDNPAFLTRTMQKYAVSIPPRQWDNLFTLGSIVIKADLFPVLVDEGLYKPDLGLCVDDPTQREPEELFA